VFLPVESTGVRDSSNNFGAAFCSVFKEFQAAEQYGCYHYFRDSNPKQMPGEVALASDQDLGKFRFVLVSGFMSGCLKGAQFEVYGDADQHLLRHHVSLERIALEGMQSVEEDARQIVAKLVANTSPQDDRRIILIGYSKGAADLEAAILLIQQESSTLNSRLAALVTVAGMIGGTRLYDQIEHPNQISSLLSHFQVFDCPVGERNFRSLSRQERQQFLRMHWQELARVPSYSLTTVSTPDRTSRVLQPLWQQLSIYGVDEDSQMAQPEQVTPGAVYLGIARADHWAVALPLEQDPSLRDLANRNHFPRAAILEALLRFVVADLSLRRSESTASPSN
jgi:hypothetical protein